MYVISRWPLRHWIIAGYEYSPGTSSSALEYARVLAIGADRKVERRAATVEVL
jgi:hypothetical protein